MVSFSDSEFINETNTSDLNKIILYQYQCLGDFVYLQKLFHQLCSRQDTIVILPILSNLEYIFKDYIQTPENFYIYDIDKPFPYSNLFNEALEYCHKNPNNLFHPISFNHNLQTKFLDIGETWRIFFIDSLRFKYKMCGMNDSSWQSYGLIQCNPNKVNQLYYEVLGLKDGEEYGLYNKKFGNQSNTVTISGTLNKVFVRNNDTHVYSEMVLEEDMKWIDLRYIEGFTLFDWLKVIQNARKITTVETSLCYLVEKLAFYGHIKSKENTLYTRWDPAIVGFYMIKDIFTKANWIFKDHSNEVLTYQNINNYKYTSL